MLSAEKLKEISSEKQVNVEQLARHIARTGLNQEKAVSAIKNWKRGLYKPKPEKEDMRRLATALSVEEKEISEWRSSCMYAPVSPRKARLVSELISGRSVQDAMDVLKFTHKRAASIIDKVLKSAVADADEQQADVDNLYVSCSRVDDAGIRIGTKRWIPKDRGRAHSISKKACHVHITVTQM